ncbi:MAG TPA: hypothetical protein VLA37_04690, partial [Sphingomonadaceae bacterium]|nr:hypothetical protein [Sphingomonadaceae bacterium]
MNIFKSFGSRLRIRGHGRWHVAASLFLVAIVLFGTAQPHPAHASEGAEPSFIEIPFAPPTDTPLRYRLVSERNADGDTMTRIFEQELQFRVAASGYELTVTTLSMSDGNITVTAEAALTNP